MKQIINNNYVKRFDFNSSKEAELFVEKQKKCDKILRLNETYGDSYYCYVFYHSLTSAQQLIILFSSDNTEDNLSLLYWTAFQLYVVDTGKMLYVIGNDVKYALEITTPLIGLYLTSENNLVILEEAYLRIVNAAGELLNCKLYNLIESFWIDNNKLSIKTEEEQISIDLI